MNSSKKILDIPFYTQQKEDTCLLSCLRMVLNSYGAKLSEIDLESKVSRLTSGKSFHIADLGTEALRLGFEVQIICFDLSWIFSEKHIGNKHDDLKNNFSEWVRSSKKNLKYRKPYLNFLNADGEIDVKMPNVEEIEKYINRGVPVITLVESRPFFGDAAKVDAGHAVVVVGYDEENVYLNDPLDPKRPYAKGKEYKMDKDLFTFCWYRRYANTLVIKPK